MRQPDNMKAAQGAGLDMNSLDFEFMTKGDPITDAQDAAGRIQQNLTPEEINEMAELAPYAEKFMVLSLKAETGQVPSEQDVDQLLAQFGQEMPSTDEQGMPSEQGSGAMMPEYMQSEASVPPMPVEGQMPQNAPEMMAEGGVVDISGILTGPKPDWLKRALDPATKMTEDNESIRGMTGSIDGRQILVPTIRMVDGELVRYKPKEAFKMAREKEDYLVLPAKSDKEAEAYSKELSNEFGRRRFEFGKVTQGMAVGGVVPAGPAGVVNQPGADRSGVGDDVPVKSDGFVINAAAVRHAGLQDINDMIQNAKTYAEKQGAKLDFGKTATGAEDILVSNGEVVIPDVIANIIGYDRLEKINNRGKKETEEKLAEQEQQPTAMQPQQPVMAALGGGILEEQDKQKEMATIEYQMDNALPDTKPVEDYGGMTTPPVEDYGKMDKARENVKLPPEPEKPFVEVVQDPMVYGYTKDQLYDGISKYEWRNQTPKFGFAGIDSNKNTEVTSAFGPAQMTSGVMDDIINDSKNFGVGKEALQLATNIRAAQTLVINLGNGFKKRGGFDPRKAANTPKGKIALQTLGISSEEFQSMVEEGFFLPSTDPKAKGLPDSILGQNYEQNYRKLFDATLQIKQNRTDVTDLNSLLEKYHGSGDKLANSKYKDGVLKVLDIMKSK